jgi:acetolactate synthase-1/2/3 large subunit
VPEDHAQSLGAFNATPEIEAFYATCDAILVVGSRLRGNETLRYTLKLPRPLYQIDADPTQQGRAYTADLFVAGDAAKTLRALADRLKPNIDPKFAADLAAVRKAAEASLRAALGPYAALVDALHGAMPRGSVWVRDVTVSNSTWGNRYLRVHGPRDGVHALGGGIGQGVPMAIGAALGADGRKTVALAGDGGLHVSLGELATLAQEKPDVTVVVMNDRGYGVIRNIQDAKFGGRRYFVDLHTPDMGELARTLGLQFFRAASVQEIPGAVQAAVAHRGPSILEIDMTAIGQFAQRFAGPPVRKG